MVEESSGKNKSRGSKEKIEKYELELQIEHIFSAIGFISFTLMSAIFILYIIYILVLSSAKIGNSIPFEITVLMSILISVIILPRLWSWFKSITFTFISLFSAYLQHVLDYDNQQIKEQCMQVDWTVLRGFLLIFFISGLMFLFSDWTCTSTSTAVIHPGGLSKLSHHIDNRIILLINKNIGMDLPKTSYTPPPQKMLFGACSFFQDSAFSGGSVLLIRLMLASSGLAFVSSIVVVYTQIVHLWRGSIAQKVWLVIHEKLWFLQDPDYTVYPVDQDDK